MKNTFLLLAAFAVNVASYAQHTDTDMKTNTSTDKAMLDGRAFVVTLSDNSMDNQGKTENMNDRKMDNTTGAQSKMDKNSTAKDDSKNGKKMVLRFENGMLRTSAKGDLKMEKCMYKSWGMESTGISFSADCNSAGTSMNGSNNMNSSTTATTVTTTTRTNDRTPVTSGGQSSTNGSVESRTGSSTGTTGTTYGSNQTGAAATPDYDSEGGATSTPAGTASTGTSATSTSGAKGTVITGTVNGDTIHGSLTCTKEDGSVRTYSYTGSKAGKNDLDMENEMGMK